MSCWYGMFRTSTPSNATRPVRCIPEPAMSFATVDLPRTAGPHDGRDLPGMRLEADAVQHLGPLVVGERHVLERERLAVQPHALGGAHELGRAPGSPR